MINSQGGEAVKTKQATEYQVTELIKILNNQRLAQGKHTTDEIIAFNNKANDLFLESNTQTLKHKYNVKFTSEQRKEINKARRNLRNRQKTAKSKVILEKPKQPKQIKARINISNITALFDELDYFSYSYWAVITPYVSYLMTVFKKMKRDLVEFVKTLSPQQLNKFNNEIILKYGSFYDMMRSITDEYTSDMDFNEAKIAVNDKITALFHEFHKMVEIPNNNYNFNFDDENEMYDLEYDENTNEMFERWKKSL